MNIEIANRLVNLRKQNSLSQEALAEKLGISRQAVSKWERAEASPDTDNLILLARLYGVSLDELLRTEDEIPLPDTEDEKAEEEAEAGKENKEEEMYTNGKNAGVHIGKDGIHVTDGGEQVHIDWNGVHVNNKRGDKVKVGWDGIRVMESGEEMGWEPGEESYSYEIRKRFPIGLVICIAYLMVGIFYQAWHPGWLLLLLIPIFDSLVTAVKRRNASRFAYPMVTLLFFLAFGIFTGNWMGWIAFLTIPLYYSLVNYFKSLLCHRNWKRQQKAEQAVYQEVKED